MDIDSLVKEKNIKQIILALDTTESEIVDKASEALRTFQKEDWSACEKAVEEIRKDNTPAGSNALIAFADMLFELGKHLSFIGGEDDVETRKKEVEAYNRTLAVNPLHASCLNNKGVTLMQLKQWREAAVCFERALKADPEFTQAWQNKAVAHWNGKDFEEAIEAAEEAVKHDSSQQGLLDYMLKNTPYRVVHLR